MTTLGKKIYMQISAAIIENRIFFNILLLLLNVVKSEKWYLHPYFHIPESQ